MAISEQYERWQSRRFTRNISGEVTYTTSYVVRCEYLSDGLITACSASMLPRPRVTVFRPPGGAVLVCKDVQGASLEGSPDTFEFVALFSNKVDEDAQFENPLLRKPEVRWGSVSGMEPRYTDADGKIVTNSSSETYDPPLEFPVSDPVLLYSDNVANYDPTLAIDLQDGVNNGALLVPTGTNGGRRVARRNQALLVQMGATSGFENGIAFMRREIEIRFRREGWNPRKVRDEGYLKIVAGKQRLILDDLGSPKNTPTLLNGAGQPLSPGANAVFREVKGFQEVSLSALSLRFP